jgi:hypothetical protein
VDTGFRIGLRTLGSVYRRVQYDRVVWGRRKYFSLPVHIIVLQTEITAMPASTNQCIGEFYTGEYSYTLPDCQTALRACETLRRSAQEF